MTQFRGMQTCARCRDGKRKCDKLRPRCTRCQRAGVPCAYDDQSSKSSPLSEEGPEHMSDGAIISDLAALSTISSHGRIVKKRARACLSCTRCHRLKVKCDKAQPCERCVRSGYETTCIYTNKAKSVEKPFSIPTFILNGKDSESLVAAWFLRSRGSSHWKALLYPLESLSGIPALPLTLAMREHIEGDCSSDLALPGNFPFGSVESTRYASLDKVQGLLEDYRADLDVFVNRYFEIYHPSMPVLEPSAFRLSISAFWSAPEQADASWLVQYLVILGLGAYASSRDEVSSAKFFYASEACLAKTPYMSRPTTTNICTLCLMVLAKQAAYATCWALDTSWNVMGVVVRLSMMAVLHQEWMPEFHDPVIVKERELRQRLWTIVVYLNIQMSLTTGQQTLLPNDALLLTTEMHSPSTLEECWDSVLPQSFPIICHFLARINSHTDQITYAEVLQYNLALRPLMRQISELPGNNILRVTLDIFFRRVLLVLHRRHALDPDAPLLYSTSYWSSLECSLAITIHNRDLYDPSSQPPNFDLIRRPYILDFFATGLTVCIHLLRSDAPLAATETPEGTIPPRQTILSTLTNCLDIFSKEQNMSVCFQTAYRLLKAVFDLLPE